MDEIFKNDIEFASAEEIKALQERLLREDIAYLAANSPYYKRVFASYDINPADIQTIDDLQRLPFTEKKDLQLYNDDFLCCPKERIVDYITTSGTLGDPVTFGCSDKDLERLAFNEKKSFACAGLRPGNILQLMTTMDKRFMAGLAYFLGIRALGASIIRVGNGIPELQWDTIRRLKPDTIMCVPSFILHLIDYAERHGINYRESSIRRIIGIHFVNHIRQLIDDNLSDVVRRIVHVGDDVRQGLGVQSGVQEVPLRPAQVLEALGDIVVVVISQLFLHRLHRRGLPDDCRNSLGAARFFQNFFSHHCKPPSFRPKKGIKKPS